MQSRNTELKKRFFEDQSVTELDDNLPEEVRCLLEEEDLLNEVSNLAIEKGQKEYLFLALDVLDGVIGRDGKPLRLRDFERAIKGQSRLWSEDKTGTYRMTDKPRRKDLPRCGARRKYDGKPCQAKALPNGRCKYHGGLSTGPKTPEGRQRTLEGLTRYHANRKLEQRRVKP